MEGIGGEREGENERGGGEERVMTGQFHTLVIIGFQGQAIQSLAGNPGQSRGRLLDYHFCPSIFVWF